MPIAETIEKIKADRRRELKNRRDEVHGALRECVRRDLGASANEVEIKIWGGIADVIAPGHRLIGAMFNVDRSVVYWTGSDRTLATTNLADALIAAEIRDGGATE